MLSGQFCSHSFRAAKNGETTITTLTRARNPRTLLYGRLDVPPPATLLMLALQHAALVAIFLIVAVTVARLASLDLAAGRNFLSLTMIAGGVGAILQALAWRGVGSGYLVPPTTTTILLPASGAALAVGGLPLLLGMTLYTGLVTAALSRVIHRLRPLFPAEIAGFVVLMVGLSVVVLAMRHFLGVGLPAEESSASVLLAGFTLGVMVVLNVWGGPSVRLFSSLLGVAIGCLAALVVGMFGDDELQLVDLQAFEPAAQCAPIRHTCQCDAPGPEPGTRGAGCGLTGRGWPPGGSPVRFR